MESQRKGPSCYTTVKCFTMLKTSETLFCHFYISLTYSFIRWSQTKHQMFCSKWRTGFQQANLISLCLTSCPVLANEQTLSMLKNAEGPEAMFRIQMFKFVGNSYTNVFLHCNVQICHSSQSLCQPVSELTNTFSFKWSPEASSDKRPAVCRA